MTGSKPMTMEEQAHKYILQKERMKETNRLWRLSHKDDIQEKMKSYYQLNKERLNKRSIELVKLKKFLLKEQDSLLLGETPLL
jgi:hypothetical protein